eukprot:11889656-Alexandrium_andersonii.AAC.1
MSICGSSVHFRRSVLSTISTSSFGGVIVAMAGLSGAKRSVTIVQADCIDNEAALTIPGGISMRSAAIAMGPK